MNKLKMLFRFSAGLLIVGLFFIGCGDGDDGEGPANVVPVVETLTGPDLVAAGGTATFVGSGTDDDGDALTYEYSSSDGSFSDGTWTAPSTDGTYTITCVANDGTDDSDPVQTTVVVASVPEFQHQWPFNDETGTDVTGGEDVTAPASASFDDGKVSGAIVFDGTDMDSTDAAFGSDTPSLAGTEDFTFSLWFATTDSGGFFFGKTFDGKYVPDPLSGNPENGSAKGLMFWVDADDGLIHLNYDNSWVGSVNDSTAVQPDGNWHQAVVSHIANDAATDPDSFNVYLDAEFVVGGVLGASNPDLDQKITMGNALESVEYGEWPGAYQGYMDEVVYWNVVLTADQVAALYDAHD